MDSDNFADEWFQFPSLTSFHKISRNPAAQFQLIKDMQISHMHFNVETCLPIFLITPVTKPTALVNDHFFFIIEKNKK